ncbi:hypothetical protein NC652_033871 [Populus alba x Populus x berolinensis]|nr:hypothetical protein NC652_033871 [Populus alba x Populus x berolinensis]
MKLKVSSFYPSSYISSYYKQCSFFTFSSAATQLCIAWLFNNYVAIFLFSICITNSSSQGFDIVSPSACFPGIFCPIQSLSDRTYASLHIWLH